MTVSAALVDAVPIDNDPVWTCRCPLALVLMIGLIAAAPVVVVRLMVPVLVIVPPPPRVRSAVISIVPWLFQTAPEPIVSAPALKLTRPAVVIVAPLLTLVVPPSNASVLVAPKLVVPAEKFMLTKCDAPAPLVTVNVPAPWRVPE